MDSGSEAARAAYRDQDDVEDVIAGWTDDDCLRLIARARAAALGTDLEPEDVFGEAVKLLLGGHRPWKVGVPFEAHVTMVMKQVGSNRRRYLYAKPTRELEVLDTEPGLQSAPPLDEAVGSAMRAKQIDGALQQVFHDDAVGWAIFEARLLEQMPVEEACEIAGIPRDQYETVLKRVTRKLAKAVRSGAIR